MALGKVMISLNLSFCMFSKDNETQFIGLSLELKQMQIVAHSHNKIHVALRKIQMALCVMLQNDFLELVRLKISKIRVLYILCKNMIYDIYAQTKFGRIYKIWNLW